MQVLNVYLPLHVKCNEGKLAMKAVCTCSDHSRVKNFVDAR